ncbi:hypothetical protein F5883DRAFT_540830 [Diaporthe sp. PMI_573]|nr:hypothetical protein F5883DRAFT_540830 [Diaporthaceae sp. PMI_573]
MLITALPVFHMPLPGSASPPLAGLLVPCTKLAVKPHCRLASHEHKDIDQEAQLRRQSSEQRRGRLGTGVAFKDSEGRHLDGLGAWETVQTGSLLDTMHYAGCEQI